MSAQEEGEEGDREEGDVGAGAEGEGAGKGVEVRIEAGERTGVEEESLGLKNGYEEKREYFKKCGSPVWKPSVEA